MPEAPDEETTCANCGAAVPKHDWHPAAVETTATGNTVIRAFCSEPCRTEWSSTPTEPATDGSQTDTTAD